MIITMQHNTIQIKFAQRRCSADSEVLDQNKRHKPVQQQQMCNKKAQLTQGLRAIRQQCVYEGPYGRSLSSAENPTLEQNITMIGKPVAKRWPFLYIQDGRQPPSWIFETRKLHHQIGRRDKPHTEPNIMSLCCIQPQLCQFKYVKTMAVVHRLVQSHPSKVIDISAN